MAKIYHNNRKIKIHLSSPPSAARLLPEEREVLCYLLTSKKSTRGSGNHRPVFNCDCFECYTSYWARWDTSPNRHVIHEILEAYEDELVGKNKRKRKKNKKRNTDTKMASKREIGDDGHVATKLGSGDLNESVTQVGDVALEKGPVIRKIVGFFGERIWGVWGK